MHPGCTREGQKRESERSYHPEGNDEPAGWGTGRRTSDFPEEAPEERPGSGGRVPVKKGAVGERW